MITGEATVLWTLSTEATQHLGYQSPAPISPLESGALNPEEVIQEFAPAFLCITIAHIAYHIFESSYFYTLCIGAASFVLTHFAAKALENYAFFVELERMTLFLSQKCPYLQVLLGLAATLFASVIPPLAMVLGAFAGALTMMTFRVHWLSAVTDARRTPPPVQMES